MLSLLVAKLTLLARGFYSADVLSQEDDFYMSLYEHVKEDQQLMLETVSRNITFWNDQLIIALEGYEQMMKPKPKRSLKNVSDSESDGEHEEDNKPPTLGGGGDESPSDSSSDDDASHSDNSDHGGGSSEEDEEGSENSDSEESLDPSDNQEDSDESDRERPPRKRNRVTSSTRQPLFKASHESGGTTTALLIMTDVETANRIVQQSKEDLNSEPSEQTLLNYDENINLLIEEQLINLAIGKIDTKDFKGMGCHFWS